MSSYNSYKRRGGYKRRYKKQKQGNIFWHRLNNKSYYMAKKALSLINVEFKNHDLTFNSTIPDAAGTIQQLTNINIGDTTNTRDGSSIKLTSFFIRGIVKMNASATATTVRLMLVQDKQTNEAIYNINKLLSDVSASDSVHSVYNLDSKFRFRVLWDKVFTLSDNGRQIIHFQYHKKLNMKMRYDGTGGGMGDITSNSLSLVRISDEATNVPTGTWVTRIRYIDN